MEKPTLYRRRFIPDETVCLHNDEIVYMNDDVIVTKWRTLKPRPDFASGCSCFFLKRGFKVSKFIDKDGKCLCHYCDIIETVYVPEKNSYIFNDLLVDVVVYSDGFVKVLDLAEVTEALEKNLISVEMAKETLLRTDELLDIIYSGEFQTLTTFLER